MTKRYVQVSGCIEKPGDYIEALQSNQQATFYGVYLGAPGDLIHVSDWGTREDALREAHDLISRGIADELDDRTYDEPEKTHKELAEALAEATALDMDTGELLTYVRLSLVSGFMTHLTKREIETRIRDNYPHLLED